MLENFGLGWKKKGNGDAFADTTLAVRCYESHPVLKLGKGRLYGGSASQPTVKDADVYVALQSGSTSGRISDPWDEQTVVEVQYSIQDMHAPTNLPRFKKLVTWVCTQLQDGKKVHVGCIGGHGRTGTLLAAIVAEMSGKKDYPAIQYVRQHYCKKAVESKEQIAFLVKHYGVETAEPAKPEYKPEYKPSTGYGDGPWVDRWAKKKTDVWESTKDTKSRRVDPDGLTKATKSYGPMASARSLWKPKKPRA